MNVICIMFVCHGNICRSPMAEYIFKNIVKEKGQEKEFFVSSSATSTEEIYRGIGNPVYPPAKRELLKHGITCEAKRAVQLKAEDYPEYDFFIGMDTANIRNMKRILDGDPDSKIYKLMSFTGSGDDVADPWYTGDFETTYSDIYKGCRGLYEYLEKEVINK